MDPVYPLYPIACFICFILVLIPLPWHFQAWNTGTCMYMIWTAVSLLCQFVNSIVWRDNAINWAPVWCDISSRVVVGSSIGIPAASLVISRRLYNISRLQAVTETPKEKRKGLIIDLGYTIGLPSLVMALFYIVQGHRFNIFEQIGCYPAAFNTHATYFIAWMWPVVLGLISTVYCVLTLTAFVKRRKEMNQFLASNSNITFSRYFRLMALASMDALLTVPLGSFAIWMNARDNSVQPWRGWADAHWGFSRVGQVPAVIWRMDYWTVVAFNLTRSFIIFCAVVFFCFFGFAEEARKNYRKAFWTVARKFGYMPPPQGSSFNGSSAFRTPNLANLSTGTGTGTHNLKVYVSTGPRVEKRDRDSFLSSIGDLSSSFSINNQRVSLDEKKDEQRPSPSGGSSPRRSFDSSLPPTPADERALQGLPQLPANAVLPSRPARTNASLDMV